MEPCCPVEPEQVTKRTSICSCVSEQQTVKDSSVDKETLGLHLEAALGGDGPV